MKIIFLEDFKLNKCGDIININNGYGRNFLIPNFKVLFLSKNLLCKINLILKIILYNDSEKKLILKKLFNKFNNKNLIIKFKFYNFNNYKNLKYILKKIGFLNYNYNILLFKEQNLKEFFIKINIYNDININFFLFII